MKKTPFRLLFLMILMAAAVPAVEKSTSPADEFPKLKLTGFTRFRYTVDMTDKKPDGFSLAALRFGLTGYISQDFSYTLTLEGTNTDNENRKLVYDAYIDTTLIRNFRIRFGQFKYGFGLEQTTPEAELDFINKSDVVNNLIKPNRDIGVQAARDIPIGSVRSTVTVAVINGSGTNLDDENNRKSVVGRLALNPFKGVQLGASYYDGTVGTADKKTRAGLDLKVEFSRLTVKAEYLNGKDKTVSKEGYYLAAVYSVLPAAQLLVRYDFWNSNRNAENVDAARWTFGVNYFFGKRVLWRTNYEMKRETPAFRNDLFLTQLQILF